MHAHTEIERKSVFNCALLHLDICLPSIETLEQGSQDIGYFTHYFFCIHLRVLDTEMEV